MTLRLKLGSITIFILYIKRAEMAVLNQNQIENNYFNTIGGFPHAPILHELSEYKGEERICVACTQLPGEEIKRFISSVQYWSEKDKRRILTEWIGFFKKNTLALHAIHVNSYTSQQLFDAVCHQEKLKELRLKSGGFSDLSAIQNLCELQFLYIGNNSKIKNIQILGSIQSLVVLHLEALTNISDYSFVSSLSNLEQLVIYGPNLKILSIDDLEFLRKMPNLRSIRFANIHTKKKYTTIELQQLHGDLPNLFDINDSVFHGN